MNYKMTLEVPKKPTTAADMWPSKLSEKSDGYYIQYRDVTIGPFPDKNEVSWYDGMIQDISMGIKDPDLFAGRIIQFGDAYYVERWDQNDGPFMDQDVAKRYRQQLYNNYNAYPADYVGIVFQQGEGKFWVDRGNRDSGPFASREEAEKYRDKVLAKINKDKTNAPGERAKQ